jgi:hypothetical protein
MEMFNSFVKTLQGQTMQTRAHKQHYASQSTPHLTELPEWWKEKMNSNAGTTHRGTTQKIIHNISNRAKS